jgi:hypothetical protein
MHATPLQPSNWKRKNSFSIAGKGYYYHDPVASLWVRWSVRAERWELKEQFRSLGFFDDPFVAMETANAGQLALAL